jgi:hypothetical protein
VLSGIIIGKSLPPLSNTPKYSKGEVRSRRTASLAFPLNNIPSIPLSTITNAYWCMLLISRRMHAAGVESRSSEMIYRRPQRSSRAAFFRSEARRFVHFGLLRDARPHLKHFSSSFGASSAEDTQYATLKPLDAAPDRRKTALNTEPVTAMPSIATSVDHWHLKPRRASKHEHWTNEHVLQYSAHYPRCPLTICARA